MPEAIPSVVYAREPWEVDLGRRELRSCGTPVTLGGRAFEIIEVLARAAELIRTKRGIGYLFEMLVEIL
jgi:DNA-binding response OmpR family regulator